MITLTPNVNQIILDAAGMDIESVYVDTVHVTNSRTEVKQLGYALVIELDKQLEVGQEGIVEVYYRTNNETTSISWLNPAQTAGGKLPYMYTQCQPIACRSLGPMQDTPAVRITYTAKILV